MEVEGRLEVGSWGWEHPGWAGSFYPPDLPADWRLSYYANEYAVVAVPAARVAGLEAAAAADWNEELPAGFGLWAELPAGAAALPTLPAALRPLAPRLRGLLHHGDVPPQGLEQLCAAIGLPAGAHYQLAATAPSAGQGVWRDDPASTGPLEGPAVLSDRLDLPALRAALERYMRLHTGRYPTLLLTGDPPGPGRLEEARTLVELMGL